MTDLNLNGDIVTIQDLNGELSTTLSLTGTIQPIGNLGGVLNQNGQLIGDLSLPFAVGGYVVYGVYINNESHLIFTLYDGSEIDVGYVKGNDLINENINSLTYNTDGSLNVITTDSGTKTMIYNNNILIGIIGTGIYPSKNFIYADGKLVEVEVI